MKKKVVYSDYFRVDRRWHGLPLFECKFCPFATVDGMPEIIRHLEGWHKKSRREVYQNIGRVDEERFLPAVEMTRGAVEMTNDSVAGAETPEE